MIFLFAIALPACGAATPAPTTDDEPARLSTAVAGTLTAITSIPTITSTPAPTATSTLAPMHQPGPLQVVYSRAGSIWIWTEGGQPKQLTNTIVDERPRLSDDGKLIVFERNNELYAVNSDGSNLHVLVSDTFQKAYLPADYKFIWPEFYDWQPGSHILYYSSMTGISGPTTDIFMYDLFRVDVDSGEVRPLLGQGRGGVPYFSADGKTLALVQPKAIYLIDADGANLRKALTFDIIQTYSDWLYFPVVVPLSNGNGFRVVIPANDWLESSTEQAKLWEIPISGDPSVIYSFTQKTLPFYSLSQDGKAVGYSENNKDRICLYKDGGPANCFSQPGALDFYDWSPDESKFIYSGYYDSPNQVGFFLGNPATGKYLRIAASSTMMWVDNARYLYIGQDGKLFLASVDATQDIIDKGISKNLGAEKWYWQFDFSD